MLWTSIINIIKMVILPKLIYRFNTIPIKIWTQFFTDLKRLILNFTRKNKKSRIAKIILFNKRTSGGIGISGYKVYYRVVVVKTAWFDIKTDRSFTGIELKINM